MKQIKMVLTLIVVFGGILVLLTSCKEPAEEIHVHEFGDWVIINEATCHAEGLKGRDCKSCPEYEREIIEKLEHTEVIDEEKEATCTETGLTKGSHCSVCNEVLVAQKVVEAKGHTEVIDKAIEDTCESIGLTEGSHCSVCDKVLKEQEIIEEIKHQYEKGICIHCKKSIEDQTPTKNLLYTLNSDGKSYSVLGLMPGSMDSKIVIAKSYEGLPVTEIFNYAFSDEENIKTVVIPSTIITIGMCAFESCENLEYIYIPDSVTSIGAEAFKNCKKLKTIELPQNIEKISSRLFLGCDGLTSFVIPKNVVTIENRAFEGCIYLEKITIPKNVTIIYEEVFYYCLSLREVIFEENSQLKIIDYQVFEHCERLTKISIPNTVEKIGHDAFGYCTSLEKIIIPKSVLEIHSYAFAYCDKLTIYCQIETKPESWNTDWNYSKCSVVWGYTCE